jgi:alpha-L-fucosidase
MNDNGIPTGGLDEYWETPQTLNTTWGYSKFDQQWKSPANVIQRLVEIVGKGGNYLLNIGPMADGTVPAPSVATLNRVGEWMRANGESIYGTSACPLGDAPWGRCTVKGSRVYLHVFSWPGDSVLRVNGLRSEARAAWLLADPRRKLGLGRDSGVITIALPATAPDPIDTVVVLDLSEAPKVDPPVLTQSSDSGFHLDYLHAVTAGKAVKRFNRDGGFHIGKWTGPGDSASWDLLVSQVGTYKATIRYAAPAGWAGVKFIVAIGKETLSGSVQTTGPEYAYGSFVLGTIRIPRAGRYTVTVHPSGATGNSLMYLQSLDLTPEI